MRIFHFCSILVLGFIVIHAQAQDSSNANNELTTIEDTASTVTTAEASTVMTDITTPSPTTIIIETTTIAMTTVEPTTIAITTVEPTTIAITTVEPITMETTAALSPETDPTTTPPKPTTTITTTTTTITTSTTTARPIPIFTTPKPPPNPTWAIVGGLAGGLGGIGLLAGAIGIYICYKSSRGHIRRTNEMNIPLKDIPID